MSLCSIGIVAFPTAMVNKDENILDDKTINNRIIEKI